MIKRIKFDDIKEYFTFEEEPYLIPLAKSSEKAIYVYFNNLQRIKVFHKCENIYEYTFEEVEINDEKKNENLHNRKYKTDSYFFSPFILSFLFPITILLMSFFTSSEYSKYAFLIAFFMSNIITTISLLLLEFYVCYKIIYIESSAFKSNHSAEHMICDFIYRKHRLPENIYEFRKANRISKYCSTIEACNMPLITAITNSFFTVIISIIIAGLLIYFGISITVSSVICICLFVTIYIIRNKKEMQIRFINKLLLLFESSFLQYIRTTSKNVTDESLIMAYLAGCQWFKLTHFEEFDENAYNRFLDSLHVSVHECDEINQL